MQRYIDQLIEDLREASWNLNAPHEIWEESGADPCNEVELEDLSFIEEYVYGEKSPISYITGIDLELLPPSELLTIEHQALLAIELENLLMCYHFYLDFPEDYPAHLRYSFILNFWKEEHVLLSFGENHIELCDYDEENCPFPGYCISCMEVAEQMKFDKRPGTSTETDFDQDIYLLLPTNEELEDFFFLRDVNIAEPYPDDENERKKPDKGMPF